MGDFYRDHQARRESLSLAFGVWRLAFGVWPAAYKSYQSHRSYRWQFLEVIGPDRPSEIARHVNRKSG
jgi:hypothetical protein